MNTYIKHSEDDSLTHYGVKGMKWKKRKLSTVRDDLIRKTTGKSREYWEEMSSNGGDPSASFKSSKKKSRTTQSEYQRELAYNSKKNKLSKKGKKSSTSAVKTGKKALEKAFKKAVIKTQVRKAAYNAVKPGERKVSLESASRMMPRGRVANVIKYKDPKNPDKKKRRGSFIYGNK